MPTITQGLAKCSPANVSDCCNTTNAVSIESSIVVNQGSTSTSTNAD